MPITEDRCVAIFRIESISLSKKTFNELGRSLARHEKAILMTDQIDPNTRNTEIGGFRGFLYSAIIRNVQAILQKLIYCW